MTEVGRSEELVYTPHKNL